MNRINGLSLFTGYGGLDLALRDYVKTIGYVEIEEYAQKIIAYRMADGSLDRAPIYSDVKNVQGQSGVCDIIFGGFPCQDISVAGLRKGLEGKRSGLFFEIVRLAQEIEPKFLFLENVPGIRTKGLRQVIGTLAEIGYDCRWTCVSAASIGAPHKRERWFLLANANGNFIRKKQIKKQKCQNSTIFGGSMEKRIIADPNSQSKKLRQTKEWGHNSFNKRIMETNSWDDLAAFFCRMDDGASFRVDRLKALGNGVVPLQAKTAFQFLLGILNT